MTQNSATDQSKRQVIVDFLKLLKLDFYLFFHVFGIVMQGVTIAQLAEDKMCINQLHFPTEYCLTLTSNHSHETSTQSILVHANTLKNWQTLIETVPSSIIAVFLSYWLEKYPHYLKTIMLIPCFGSILKIFVFVTNAFFFKVTSWAILLAYLPTGFCGGVTLLLSSFMTYVSWSTPTRFLVLRFALVELVISVAVLAGTYTGGHVLAMKPWFPDQPENYLGVLLVSFILITLSLILGCIVHLEGVPETPEHLATRSHKEVAKDVFQLSRFKELAEPLVAKRSGADRLKLIFFIFSGLIIWTVMSGDEAIGFQFAQQVYGWSATKYTELITYINSFPVLLTVIVPQILKSFKVRDSAIGLIGVVSFLTMNAIKGLITNEIGFALAYTSGGLNTLANIANRALISQIIDPQETAKVFAIITSINSYASIGAAYLYTTVFNLSMAARPGLIYNIATLALLFPMITFLIADISAFSSKGESQLPTKIHKAVIQVHDQQHIKPHTDRPQIEIITPTV